MGSKNVKLVYDQWRHLEGAPFRALAYMANVSMDQDRPPRFFQGRERLAHALGRTVPEAPDESDSSEEADSARLARKAAFEAVRRVTQKLLDVGAITYTKQRRVQARAGLRSEFFIILEHEQVQTEHAPEVQAESVSEVQTEHAPEVQADGGKGTGSAWLQVQAEHAPKEYEEQQEPTTESKLGTRKANKSSSSPKATTSPTLQHLLAAKAESEKARNYLQQLGQSEYQRRFDDARQKLGADAATSDVILHAATTAGYQTQEAS